MPLAHGSYGPPGLFFGGWVFGLWLVVGWCRFLVGVGGSVVLADEVPDL